MIQKIFTQWQVFLTTLFLMFLGLLSSYSATQNIDGTLEGYPYIDWEGQFSFDVTADKLVYCTRDFPSRFHGTGRTYTVKISPSKTGPIINGNLVSYQTLQNIIEPGLYGHFYEGVHADIYLTPDFEFGKIIGHDPDNNTIDILVATTRKTDHYGNNPDTIITAQYTDQADFFIEDSASTETKAMEKLGKWIQVHPPRQQIIWVETEASDYDYTMLPHYDDAGRGTASSATGMAYFDSFTADGNIEIYRKLHDDTINEIFYLPTDKSWLDGKICPSSVAIKPGREFAACCRRGGTGIDEEMVRTRDDEIRGTITAIDGNSFTVEAQDWDRNTYETTVNITSNPRIWLDGNDTTDSAIEVGREVRILPERNQKRIVVLNEYVPGAASSTYKPMAYFHPDKPYATGNHEFTFDGSHSYDLDGTINSYEWDFGDGNNATGEVVTHTFNNGNAYKAYKVALTVTNEDGETATYFRYITVIPEKRKAEDILVENLNQGLVHREWNSGCDFGLEIDCGEPDVNEIVDKTLIFTNAGLNEFTGYIKAPEDGWYEFRLTERAVKLWIDDWFVVDNERDSWGIWNYNNRKGNVYLEAGLHPITFQTTGDNPRTNLIGWSGPGVVPQRKTVDELRGDGDGAETYARLVLEDNLYYNPDDYDFLEANASVGQKQGDAPLSVNFSADASMGSIDSYTWIFGDGDTAYTKNPAHTFSDPGYYKTKLIIADADGNTVADSVFMSVINPHATADYVGVSVDFSYNYLSSADSVIGAIELSNWNNVEVPGWGSGHKAEANDLYNSFNAPTGMGLYAEDIKLNGGLLSDETATADHEMLSEGIYRNLDLAIFDIPETYKSSGYDVYVYMANEGYAPDRDSIMRASINGQEKWLKKYPEEGWDWDGQYVEATATTEAEALSGPGTNYFTLKDLTADTVHIYCDDDSKIGGLQIVTSNTIKKDQTIHFKKIENKLVDDASFDIYATASSDLLIDYSVISGPASVSGNTVTLDGTTGVVEIKASQAGNTNYNSAEAFQTFNVIDAGKADQTISFSQVPDKTIDDSDFKVKATASSGLPVNIVVVDGPATMLNDSMISLTGSTGYVTLNATQEGDASYNPAPMVLERFKVTETPQPGITLIYPYSNTLFYEGNTITLSADVSLGDETLDVVEFYEGGNKLGAVSSAPYTFEWADLQLGSYTFSARLTTSEGTNIYSQEVNITVDQLMDVEIATVNYGFLLYPNPTTGLIQIKMDALSDESAVVEVYTLQGMKVLTENITDSAVLNIDLSDEADGMYFVKVGNVVKNIIKE